MKKIILFLLTLTLFTVSVYIFIRISIFASSLKSNLQAQLTSVVSKPVKIKNLAWRFPNKIIVKEIQFDGFNCDELVASVNFKKIRNGLGSIKSISLVNPQINLPFGEFQQKQSVNKATFFVLPAEIFVINGAVVFSDTFSTRNINLEVNNKNNRYVVGFNADVIMCAKKNLSLSVIKKVQGDFNITTKDNSFNVSGDLKSEDAGLKINCDINSKKTDLQVSGDVKIAKEILLQNIKANIVVSDGECVVNSTVTIFSGEVALNGRVQKNNLDVDLMARDIKVSSSAVLSGVSFDTKITGTLQSPKIMGNIKVNNRNISGRVLWEDGEGYLKMSGFDFTANVSVDELKNVKGNIKCDATDIVFSGNYNKIDFDAKNIDTSILDKNVSGFAKLDGHLINVLSKNMGVTASVSADVLSINGSTTSLSADISYSDNGFDIHNLLADGLSGEISVDATGRQHGELNFSKCDSNIILPYIGIKSDTIYGAITGKIKLNGELKHPEPSGTIVMTSGKVLKSIPYNLIVTSFETNKSKLTVTEFAIEQEPSKMAVRFWGELDENKFDFFLKLNEFAIMEKTINGDIHSTGRKLTDNTMQFNVVSGDLAVDKISEKLFIEGVRDGEKIDIKKVLYGDKIKGNISYSTLSKRLLSAIDFKIEAGCFSKNLQGQLGGNVAVDGNIKDLRVVSDCFFDGQIYGKTARVDGNILLNNGVLKTEKAKLFMDGASSNISGTVDFNKNEFLGLNISATNVKTETLYCLLKGTFPICGTLDNLNLNVSGSFGNPRIVADFSGKNMFVDNKKTDSINGGLTLHNKRIIFSQASIKWSDANIKLLSDSYIDFKKKIVFCLKTEIRNVKFPGIVLFGDITIDGVLTDIIDTNISTLGLWVNQKQLRDSTYHIAYSTSKHNIQFIPITNEAVQMTGSINFSGVSSFFIDNFSIFENGKKLFCVNGSKKKDNLNITASGSNIVFGDLLNLFGVKITAQGDTTFNIKATGTPIEPTIDCLLTSTNGKFGEVVFDTASVSLQLSENVLKLSQLDISQKKLYSLEGQGTIPLPLTERAKRKLFNKPIDVSLKITDGNLSILSSLTKHVKKAKGNFSTNINVKGTINKPRIKGNFTVFGSVVHIDNIFKKLTDVKCQIDFSDEKIELQNMNALIDGEPITFTGAVTLADGFDFGNFDFHLLTPRKSVPVTINDLPIKVGGIGEIIPMLSDITMLSNPSKAKIKTDVRFYGTADNWNIDGYAKLSDARFTYPGPEGDSESGGSGLEILKNANWNLKIITEKNCWYERDFVSVEAKGELLLHGKGSSPLVTGKVLSLRGELDYLGRNFTIKEAVFEADKSNLFLSGIAETEAEIEKRREDLTTHQMIVEYVPETIILTVDRGPLDYVKPRFSSKTSQQSDEQLLAQAAMGLADTKQKQPFSLQEVSKIVDTLLTTPFIKTLLKRTGFVDKFAIKRDTPITPLVEGKLPSIIDLYKGTKVQVGKSFAKGFSAGYGVKFDELENKLSLRHEIELSYQTKNGVIFRTTKELEKNNEGESKFFLEKYWRFGAKGRKRGE